MIIGTCEVENGELITHRKNYALGPLSEYGVKPAFRAPALLIGGGLATFAISFADILYLKELAFLIITALVITLVGWSLGQLQLLSRDLKNTEESVAVWGTMGDLQKVRRQISEEVKKSVETSS